MAKHFFHGKRRGIVIALSAALCTTLALGTFAACGGTTDEVPDDGTTETETPATPTATDTQLLRNGNFEFFSERETKTEDKRAFIASPTSWSFTSGSPSSITTSGIVKADEWKDILTKSTYSLVPAGAVQEIGTNESSTSFTAKELTEDIAKNAEDHWDEASVYDRLLFYKYYGVDSEEEFSKYADYRYSIDYEDVQYFASDLPDGLTLRDDVKDDENAVLMIHNKRDSDDVLGTAQYYTSSTTITLEAGTAAEVSVWVRTDKLYHWFDASTVGEKEEVRSRAGAYIGVINTVGGTTLSEMQIKNIRTGGQWQQYTIYVRANTYATTTFRLKLGLGQGSSSDNRYEMVDGYAFFDDVTVTKMKASAYETAVENVAPDYTCDINSDSEDKIFNRDTQNSANTYALDLLSDDFKTLTLADVDHDHFDAGLTTEKVSDNKTYYSFVKDNRTEAKDGEKAEGTTDADKQSVVGMMTYGALRSKAQSNGYLKNIFENDFRGKFPFGTDEATRDTTPVLLLLSTNGAAYTATVKNDKLFTLEKDSRMLVSFFVKTSDIRDGLQGAGVTLVDGEDKTSISPFNTTTVSPVTIDSTKPELTDIYAGWVRCFFFVANDTDNPKTFHLEFTYGTTTVQGTDASSYGDGYAAFTGFEVMPLTKTQYSYASTGTYAQKVSLTSYVENTSKFTTAEASSNIKEELAAPSTFIGVVAGSNIFEQGGEANTKPEGIEAGLLNKEYAETYLKAGLPNAESAEEPDGKAWARALNTIAGISNPQESEKWWSNLFGENGGTGREANQPLVILNTANEAALPYGYINRSMTTTLSANSSQRISLRVKVAVGTTAYIYLLDTSDSAEGLKTFLAPSVPKYTYWYDDDGNILRCDPESDDFNKKNDILFYLEANGLYSSKNTSDTKMYANLANYKQDENGNLLTANDVIAFYLNKADNKYYGYREETSKDNYTYSQPVEPLPTTYENKSILRYDYSSYDPKNYESVIAVTGTEENKDQWIDVNFYIRTSGKSKTYRLELWAGDRRSTEKSFPADGYVFFDAYSSGSVSNFADLRDETKDALLETEANQLAGDPEKLNESLAFYYTFTFFDSADYLRHDREHEEVDYNKWENYTQSSYEEDTVWLKCYDVDGSLFGKAPSYSVYLDFTPLEVSVSEYTPEPEAETPEEEEEETPDSGTNVWLILSSSVLAFVTLFAVGAVIFRTIRKKHKPSTTVKKVKKEKKVKNVKPAPTPQDEAPAPETKPKDDDDPYND